MHQQALALVLLVQLMALIVSLATDLRTRRAYRASSQTTPSNAVGCKNHSNIISNKGGNNDVGASQGLTASFTRLENDVSGPTS